MDSNDAEFKSPFTGNNLQNFRLLGEERVYQVLWMILSARFVFYMGAAL